MSSMAYQKMEKRKTKLRQEIHAAPLPHKAKAELFQALINNQIKKATRLLNQEREKTECTA